ncbi:MAG: hypothetical protein WB996_09210 [Ignavibacteriaceae bacterium]
MNNKEEIKAEKIREACAKEFIRAYEEAGIKGLCEVGRIEYAVDAVRALDLKYILDESKNTNKS